jgi:fructuronate reductase
MGILDDGVPYDLQDPRQEEIKVALEMCRPEAGAVSRALHHLPGLFPERLLSNEQWQLLVERKLAVMIEKGIKEAIDIE